MRVCDAFRQQCLGVPPDLFSKALNLPRSDEHLDRTEKEFRNVSCSPCRLPLSKYLHWTPSKR